MNLETVIIEKKQFDEMLGKMERISVLLALNLAKDCNVQKDKILMLSSLGYGVTEIAKLLNTTVGTVNQALVRSRKEKTGRDDKSAKPVEENKEEGSQQDV